MTQQQKIPDALNGVTVQMQGGHTQIFVGPDKFQDLRPDSYSNFFINLMVSGLQFMAIKVITKWNFANQYFIVFNSANWAGSQTSFRVFSRMHR